MTTKTMPHARPNFALLPSVGFVFGFLSRAATVRRQRNCLAKLDASRLHDLGLTRAEATTEASRIAWDVPANWRA